MGWCGSAGVREVGEGYCELEPFVDGAAPPRMYESDAAPTRLGRSGLRDNAAPSLLYHGGS